MTLPRVLVCALPLFTAAVMSAQVPASENAELEKLIRSGLPESVVLNTIHTKAGHFDTSADALISLKKAGATESELVALTAPTQVSEATPASRTQSQPVSIFGGTLLHTEAGDPYLIFPTVDGYHSCVGTVQASAVVFYLGLYDGGPAVQTQVIQFATKTENNHQAVGSLTFTEGAVFYDKFGYEGMEHNIRPVPEDKWMIHSSSIRSQDLDVSFPERGKYFGASCGREMTYLTKERASNYTFGPRASNRLTPAIQDFIRNLTTQFNPTVAKLFVAARISDPDRELSASAHFRPSRPEEWPDLHQARGRLFDAIEAEPKMPERSAAAENLAAIGGLLNAIGQSTQAPNALTPFSKGYEQTASVVNVMNTAAGNPSVAASNASAYGSPSLGSPQNSDAIQQALRANLAKLNEQKRSLASRQAGAKPVSLPGAAQEQAKSQPPKPSGSASPAIQQNAAGATQVHTAVATNGLGTPVACATTVSGSQLPLVPGTTVGTCNPSSCRDMGYSMRFESKWTDAKKTEVVGYFDNNSIGDATCVWAFHKKGIWTDQGEMHVKSGAKHQGGEFGGVWSTGTDSSTVQYACFAGIDPVDAQNKPCTQNVHFAGQTNAGTDK